MAEKTAAKPKVDAEGAQGVGDHDRVALLSLRADGTPDQINPEVIVDEKDPRLA